MTDLVTLDSSALVTATGGIKHTTNAQFLKSAKACYELPITDLNARVKCYDKAAGKRWDLF